VLRGSRPAPQNDRVATVAQVNRLILPAGLPLAIGVGLLLPGLGSAAAGVGLGPVSFTDWCIITIFFINGLQIRFTGAKDRALFRAVPTVLGINLILAPLLGWAGVRLIEMPLGLVVGIALMAAVPTTMSSAAVIAINVGGDRLWALLLTIVTVLVGAFTAPIALSAILSSDVALDPWPILGQVVLTVVLPTAVGYGVRKAVWRHPPDWLSIVPSVAVLAVVWVNMSTNADAAKAMPLVLLVAMAAAAAVGHGALLGAAGAASAGLPVRHAMPVLFVASQKTLPLALSILAIVAEQVPAIDEVAAVATITCLVWHFLQLIADSALSQRLALRHARRLA
jgi:sodium/bile acid cotransporter 7